MNSYSFNLPVVAQDLPPAESLHQMFDNLKYLDDVVNDLFSRIQSRISFERCKIQAVVTRVANCQAQVAKIQANSSKATTVHSIAKYPAPKALPNYPRLSDETVVTANTHIGASVHQLSKEERLSRAERPDTSALFVKLTDASRSESRAQPVNITQEGLGRLPSHLPSVSSILLFNTRDNPYKKYESLNNLEGVAGKDREKATREVSAAPQTLIDGDILPVFAGPDFGFKPKMGDVPTFALPSVLDLPGIADISWSMDGSTSIAPSQGNLNANNSIKYLPAPAPAPMKALPAPQGYSAPPPPPGPAGPPPPPGPPGPPAGARPPGPPTGPPVTAGPPVPPPAAGPPVAPPPTAAAPPPPAAAPLAAPDNGRNALLESIRNPGMRLRKVAEQVDREDAPAPKKKAPPADGGADAPAGDAPAGDAPSGGKKKSAPPPMDMMSALAAKLKMRAKAMSGKQDEEDGGKALSAPKPAAAAPKALGPPPKAPDVPAAPAAPAAPSLMDKSKMANVDAYLAHKTKAVAKDDDDWED